MIQGAWPVLIKTGAGAAAAISSTAASALGGQLEAEFGGAVGFTAAFSSRVSRRSLGRGDGPLLPLSETCLLQLSRPPKGQKGLPQVGVPQALLLI